MKTKPFNVQELLPLAWKICWDDNMAKRAKGHDYRDNTYHLTASDIENQLRQFAEEIADGKPVGSTGRAWGRAWRSGVRIVGGSDLQWQVRNWLRRNPKLVSHNFGRGHISGERYRPVGEPLYKSEAKTIAQHEEQRRNPKPKPVHYAVRYGGAPLCTKARRSIFSRGSRYTRSTNTKADVTCARCLKLATENKNAE